MINYVHLSLHLTLKDRPRRHGHGPTQTTKTLQAVVGRSGLRSTLGGFQQRGARDGTCVAWNMRGNEQDLFYQPACAGLLGCRPKRIKKDSLILIYFDSLVDLEPFVIKHEIFPTHCRFNQSSYSAGCCRYIVPTACTGNGAPNIGRCVVGFGGWPTNPD